MIECNTPERLIGATIGMLAAASNDDDIFESREMLTSFGLELLRQLAAQTGARRAEILAALRGVVPQEVKGDE